MPFGSSQINQPPFPQYINTLTIRQQIFFYAFPNLTLFLAHLGQGLQVDFHIEMTRIADYGPVFHNGKMLLPENLDIPGHGTEEIPQFSCVQHGHHAIAIHYRLQGAQRIYLGDDYVGPHSLGSHCHAATAPTVACHHKGRTGQQPIGGPDDGIHRALTGSIPIVEQVFGVGVINGNYWIGQHAFGGHAFEAYYSCGGFLGSGNDFFQKISLLRMDCAHQISPVVHGNLGSNLQSLVYMAIVGIRVFALDGKHRDFLAGNQKGRHIILGAQRVGSA